MSTQDSKQLREQIESDLDDHIDRIQRAIRQPSVSVDRNGLRGIAELARDYLEEIGCDEAELVETDGAPGVWGYYDAGAEKTIVNYGMLDTRPVGDEDEWTHDPFGGELVETEAYGRVIYGRGAIKVKGAFVAWLNALEATKHALGELPVNVMFLLEAEEINGSPHYYEMLDRYADRIRDADACLCPLAGQSEDGNVTGSLGYKSALYFTLQVSGDRWGRGPVGGDIHAMSNATVDSPAWRLVDALSSLTAENGTQIEIDGFYDQYEPPTEDERAEVRAFVDRFDTQTETPRDELWQHLPGLSLGGGEVTRLKADLQDNVVEAFVQHFYGPESCNIQGINTGFLGSGTGTKPFILPGEGHATLDLRMPRGFDPDIAHRQLRDHLDNQGFEDVDIDVFGKHTWCKTDPDSDLVVAAREVFEDHGTNLTLWPFSAAGIPWAVFGTRFDIPVLYGIGLGYGTNSDGADEFIVVDGTDTVGGLVDCELSHAEILLAYADR
ncbi:M20/M25/M40 family metallo-hydrolase [Natrialba sp. SSL1]|uniref:M20/M25/M40 family metallo-hydrolase n=1 Tax=Natrialba sp. SSL1 TaxID=1869245 RepID=UPI0008F92A44|nr:M20/M25/M40 family metallo-hydrolase [Natrialba sp. SSL1]OIB57547.1 peptidase M20 [Natrialba sp. SSL1]